MQVSAKADYAVRAAVELANQAPGVRLKAEQIALAQDIPNRFLNHILAELNGAEIIQGEPDLGFELASPAAEITLTQIVEAVDGPLGTVKGQEPPEVRYRTSSRSLIAVWSGVQSSLRDLLGSVSLADVAGGVLPEQLRR